MTETLVDTPAFAGAGSIPAPVVLPLADRELVATVAELLSEGP